MKEELQYVRIHFRAPVYSLVTKDRAAKFTDMFSEIGGTMGLLTGFSIISAVEIVYFVIKISFSFLKNAYANKVKKF